jgi:hypothetical protein
LQRWKRCAIQKLCHQKALKLDTAIKDCFSRVEFDEKSKSPLKTKMGLEMDIRFEIEIENLQSKI